ncbi:C-GCAxxG-C-C family protein [Alkalicella caledoniensis]|nr:C-GCAxxG-C-C family protein [Alkalicella caledoniensis]
MAKEVGYPYNQVPIEAFQNAGGGYGQGTLCGALGAAFAFVGAVCDQETAKKIVSELSRWYKVAEFPIYQPGTQNPTTVAESVLCSESVLKFMDVAGVEHGSDERKERCAGLTADVAKKTIELLNAEIG